MTHRTHIVSSLVVSSLIVSWWLRPTDALADHHAMTATTVSAALPGVTWNNLAPSYVGTKKCKKCHIKQHKSWDKTRMSKAFDILKPGNSADMKKKFKLDVDKDYTTDKQCLKCHTVGFGQAGGYATPDPSDKKSVRTAKKLEGIGCESCHGPGSEYVPIFEEIMKSKRKYKVDELYAAGLTKIGPEVCLTCHNEESPTVSAGDTFDYETRKEEGTHEHLPLKQREE